MNVFPMNREDQRHWVVRCLRYYGYILTTACLIVGYAAGSAGVAQLLMEATGWPKLLSVALSTLVCGAVGLCAGLLISLPLWAVSMALDDLHAMRQYMRGFVVIGDKYGKEEKLPSE